MQPYLKKMKNNRKDKNEMKKKALRDNMKKKFMAHIVWIGMILTVFSTIGSHIATAAPAEPMLPIPAAGSSGVTIFINLRWTGGEPNLTFDVYFGTMNPPSLVATNLSQTVYEPPTRLLLNTTYYWQIVEFNSAQESTPGSIWSFTTAGDSPPFSPVVLDGPVVAGPGISLKFQTVAPDPEGDQIYYQWDWGDGNMSDWLGPYAFGEHTETSYQWAQNGSYNIRVRAMDTSGKISGWSTNYKLSIAPQIHLMNLKPGFLYLIFGIFDKTYGYIHSLDLLGMSLVISTGGLTVNATGSDAVHTVIFEMANRILVNERSNVTINNETGHSFEGYFTLNNGLYETTASAYDAQGRLIDRATRPYVSFYVWQFFFLKQILGRNTP